MLYGLHTTWLTASQRRRLDGFQARCLRKILGIPPSFLSHIPNSTVLQAAETRALSTQLLEQQLALFGKAARSAEGSTLRDAFFAPGGYTLRSRMHVRRRGRPKQTWEDQLLKHAVQACGGEEQLPYWIANKTTWRHCIRKYLHST